LKSRSTGWWVVLALAASACGAPEQEGLGTRREPSDLQHLSQAPSLNELDLTPPQSVVTVTPDADSNGEYHGPVTVTIQATDDSSGVASITYSLDGATTGTATVAGSVAVLPVITAPGTTSITYFAVDVAMNIEYSRTLSLTVILPDPPPPPPPPAVCVQIDLNDYNVFLLGNYSGGTDVQGKVAAGGNIDMQYFSVGAGLAASDVNGVLVAGGNLSLQHGGIFGSASYGGTLTTNGSVTVHRGALAQGTPINFTAAGVALGQLSANLHAQTVNGATRIEAWGGLFLEGTDAVLNVFQVDASVFATTRYLSISAPAQSVVVVNVVGTAATFAGFSTEFSGGIDQTGVLFNFVNATSITASNHGFFGTVLAPLAHIDFSNGSFDGGIYAGSMSGNAEGHINSLREIDLCASPN